MMFFSRNAENIGTYLPIGVCRILASRKRPGMALTKIIVKFVVTVASSNSRLIIFYAMAALKVPEL